MILPGRVWWGFVPLALVRCDQLAGIGEPILKTDGGAPSAPSEDGGSLVEDGGSERVDATLPGDGSQAPTEAGPAPADGNVADRTSLDANLPDTFTPPPPAGKPGFDLVVAGTYGKSASFTLIATVGESPGGNGVGSSSHYVLKAGVIAVTQQN